MSDLQEPHEEAQFHSVVYYLVTYLLQMTSEVNLKISTPDTKYNT